MKTLRIVLWAAVAVVAASLGWISYQMTTGKEEIAAGPFGVPFELVSQTGQPITQAAFTGKPTALFFGFTHCPEVCPTTLFELNGWLEKVDPDGTKLQAYFISVDPERDTPEVLGQYVSNVSKRITGISGPPDKVMEMVKGFGSMPRRFHWTKRTLAATIRWTILHRCSCWIPRASSAARSPMRKIRRPQSRNWKT